MKIDKRILVIDDEEFVLMTTTMLLKKYGARVESAENGEQGAKLAVQQHFDCILLDIMMPHMDGWEVLRYLKKEKVTENSSIIIFTAADVLVSEKQAREYGASGVLRKPFNVEKLLDILQEPVTIDT